MKQRIVARFRDGETLKGFTGDLFPNKDSFRVEADDGGDRRRISLDELKAVFYVKSFEGDHQRREQKEGERAGYGKKIRVVFGDSEEIVGYTSGYTPNRAAIFVFPVDPESNNERILVVNGATDHVEFV